MRRVFMIHAGGAESLAAACNTKPRYRLKMESHGPQPDQPIKSPALRRYDATGALCEALKVFGCNVNPRRTGTTGGEYPVIARRTKF